MKTITILLLHMQHGGIEKQTITLANELCKKYNDQRNTEENMPK